MAFTILSARRGTSPRIFVLSTKWSATRAATAGEHCVANAVGVEEGDTLDLYSHVVPGMQEEAAKLEALLFG